MAGAEGKSFVLSQVFRGRNSHRWRFISSLYCCFWSSSLPSSLAHAGAPYFLLPIGLSSLQGPQGKGKGSIPWQEEENGSCAGNSCMRKRNGVTCLKCRCYSHQMLRSGTLWCRFLKLKKKKKVKDRVERCSVFYKEMCLFHSADLQIFTRRSLGSSGSKGLEIQMLCFARERPGSALLSRWLHGCMQAGLGHAKASLQRIMHVHLRESLSKHFIVSLAQTLRSLEI